MKTRQFQIILCLTLLFTSCSNIDSELGLNDDSKEFSVREIYSKYYKESLKNATLIDVYGDGDFLDMGKTPIDLPSEEYDSELAYLLSLSNTQLDSLAQCFTFGYTREEDEIASNANIEDLISRTSEEDVNQLFDFMENYAQIGGHSITYVEDNVDSFCPEIKNLAIKSAAEFDRFTGTTLAQLNDDPIDGSFCKSILAMECGGSLVSLAINLMGSEEDPFMIVGCGTDLLGIIDAVKNYHNCVSHGVM